MSEIVVGYPIVAALVKAEEVLGTDRRWIVVNSSQADFITKFFPNRTDLKKFNEKELRSWIGFIAEKLNAILKKEGFSIELKEFKKDEFGVVSILDVLAEWLKEGERSHVSFEDVVYQAVHFRIGSGVFSGYDSTLHPSPVACLATKSGDYVYMTVAEKPLAGFELVDAVEKIRDGLFLRHFDHLLFPMVDIDQVVDISWLINMTTKSESGDEFLISQALQQTKFKMNQYGTRVKSAVAIGVSRSVDFDIMPEEWLRIDKPFYLWIEREGIARPILAVYINQADWKDPGDLANI